jgi:uroporphyrinogen decarboxylase
MRQAGRYLPEYRALRKDAGSFLDLVYNPDFAIDVTLQPIRRFAMDAAILFSDILVIPHALGQKVAFKEGHGPVLEPLDPAAPLNGLDLENIHEILSPIYQTVKGVRADLPGGVALIGFAGAPWTVATYMVEGGGSPTHAKTKSWAYRDPEGFQTLIDLLVEASVEYLLAQIEAGAEAIQLFDTWAGSLPESAMRRWCIEPAKEITARLRQVHPDIPVIGFPRGVGPLYVEYARGTGVNCLGIDTALSPRWAAENLQPLAVVQGNLDPRLVVVGGEAMRQEARAILQALQGGPHIFNLGHGFVPETPPEHVAELSELLHAHGNDG